MSFERPQFLLALLLAILPAVLYLSRYVRSTRTVFPAAYFLFGKDRAPLARLRSRQIVAALLRAGVIALAALAFAGPVLSEGDQRRGAGGKERLVILLDASASMAAGAGESTAYAEALAGATALLDDAPEDLMVALVSCPRPATRLSWLTVDRARQALAETDLSWQACRPGPLLEWLVPTLERSTRIHLFSDLRFDAAQWAAVEKAAAGATNLELHRVGRELEGNASLARLVPTPEGLDVLLFADYPEPTEQHLSVRCPGHSAEVRATVPSRRLHTLSVPLPADLEPGECTVLLEPDSLPHDDTLWVQVRETPETRVLVVDGAPSRSPGLSAAAFLVAALKSSDARPEVIRIAQTELTWDSLQLADLLILVDPRPLPAYLERGLLELMAGGGRVWLFAGPALGDWPTDGQLLPGVQTRRCVTVEEQPFRLAWLSPEDPAAAVLRALPESALRSWTHLRHVALTFQGREARLAVPFARGELVVWTLVPDGENGSFALHPAFPLLVQAFFHEAAPAAARVDVPRTCIVGRTCEVADAAAPEGPFEGAGEGDERLSPGPTGEVTCLRPGPYYATGPEGRHLAFACRAEPAESRLPMPRELPAIERAPEAGPKAKPRRTWRFDTLLLLAALGLVFVELWMVSGRLRDRYEG
jgi:hypothetical protein